MLKLNTPIEVTKKQYNYLRTNFRGLLDFKKEKGKYFIKVLSESVLYRVETILNSDKFSVH